MYILLKEWIYLKNSLTKRYSGITGVFLKKSDQTEEFREKNHSLKVRPFERINTLAKANHPIGVVMYYVKSHLIIMGSIRVDWVKLRISKLKFSYHIDKEQLIQNSYPEIIGGTKLFCFK